MTKLCIHALVCRQLPLTCAYAPKINIIEKSRCYGSPNITLCVDAGLISVLWADR